MFHILESIQLLTINRLFSLLLSSKFTAPTIVWIWTSLQLFDVRQTWKWWEVVSSPWELSTGSVIFIITYNKGLLHWESLSLIKQTSCTRVLSSKSPSLGDSGTCTQTHLMCSFFNSQESGIVHWIKFCFQSRSLNCDTVTFSYL